MFEQAGNNKLAVEWVVDDVDIEGGLYSVPSTSVEPATEGTGKKFAHLGVATLDSAMLSLQKATRRKEIPKLLG